MQMAMLHACVGVNWPSFAFPAARSTRVGDGRGSEARSVTTERLAGCKKPCRFS
jgi:hypothetical protein